MRYDGKGSQGKESGMRSYHTKAKSDDKGKIMGQNREKGKMWKFGDAVPMGSKKDKGVHT